MTDALLLCAAVEVIGLLAVPIAAFLLPGCRGSVALAPPLGLLLAAFPAWLLASVHVARYGTATIWLGSMLLATACATAWARGWRLRRADVRTLAIAQAVFIVLTAGALVLRAFSPDVWGVEKPMDMAFVNAINRAGWFPPPDPWLSGTSLNYYYLGHYLVAWLVRLTGTSPATAFNAVVALTFGMTASAVFGVTSSLSAFVDGSRTSSRRTTTAGLVAVVLAMLLGTLAAVTELVHLRHGLLGYDWAAPARVVPHTANDFPFYSLLLGDLHAHVLAVPLSLVVLAFTIRLAARGPRLPASGSLPRTVAAAAELIIAALALGALAATNTFAAPAAFALGAGGALIWAAESRRWATAVMWIGAWAGCALLLFLPFLLRFSPGTHGIGLVDTHSPIGRFVRDELVLYSVFALALAPLYVRRLERLGLRRRWARGALVAAIAVVVVAAIVGAGVPVLVALLLAISWHAVIDERAEARERCLWLVVAMGVTAALVGELVYVRDAFDTGPDYRFNTVFKFGYQSWYLLAIAAGVVVASRPVGRASRVWLAAGTALVAGAAVYSVAGSYSASGGFAGRPTLDGLSWLRARSPDDLAAIRWMRDNVRGHPTILEATGADYDARGHGRVSVFTGLPTVLGWLGHEDQWNHRAGSRWNDVHTIYATQSIPSARSLLERYGVKYVFVGDLERSDYSPGALAKFAALGDVVFARGQTRVYRLARMAPPPAGRPGSG